MPVVCWTCKAENELSADDCFHCGRGLYVLTHGMILASRYTILKPIGKGGMGMVYRAHDRELDEEVALKALRPDVSRSEQMAGRFRAEIKLARRVRHENVCAIHEYGQDQHLRFIVMELIEGTDLKAWLRERQPTTEQVLDILIQIADGLEAIHRAGIIHRDLKSPNIMVDRQGRVRVMDFGIAKGHGDDSLTGTGHLVGTPEYMSPEQARGEPLDGRSDLYALGIVIYEMFAGDVPFRGDTPHLTIFKQIEELPRLTAAGSRIPPEIVPIVEKALAKKADDRYASAREMAAALREVRGPSSYETRTVLRAPSPSSASITPAPPPVRLPTPLPTSASSPPAGSGGEEDGPTVVVARAPTPAAGETAARVVAPAGVPAAAAARLSAPAPSLPTPVPDLPATPVPAATPRSTDAKAALPPVPEGGEPAASAEETPTRITPSPFAPDTVAPREASYETRTVLDPAAASTPASEPSYETRAIDPAARDADDDVSTRVVPALPVASETSYETRVVEREAPPASTPSPAPPRPAPEPPPPQPATRGIKPPPAWPWKATLAAGVLCAAVSTAWWVWRAAPGVPAVDLQTAVTLSAPVTEKKAPEPLAPRAAPTTAPTTPPRVPVVVATPLPQVQSYTPSTARKPSAAPKTAAPAPVRHAEAVVPNTPAAVERPPAAPVVASPSAAALATSAPIPAPEPGTLKLKVKPSSAEVFVDGRKALERTVSLPPGPHIVLISHPDYETLKRTVVVKSGQPLSLEVDVKDEGIRRNK